jgi:hypothetical protein
MFAFQGTRDHVALDCSADAVSKPAALCHEICTLLYPHARLELTPRFWRHAQFKRVCSAPPHERALRKVGEPRLAAMLIEPHRVTLIHTHHRPSLDDVKRLTRCARLMAHDPDYDHLRARSVIRLAIWNNPSAQLVAAARGAGIEVLRFVLASEQAQPREPSPAVSILTTSLNTPNTISDTTASTANPRAHAAPDLRSGQGV